MAKKVIRIRCRQLISYDQLLDVSEDQFNELMELQESGDDTELACRIDDILDHDDVYDCELPEDIEIEEENDEE